MAVRDTWYFNRILECQKQAGARPLLGFETKQVPALEIYRAAGNLISAVSGKHLCESALARAVRSHDSMDFAGSHREIYSLEYLDVIHGGAQITYFKQYFTIRVNHPTLPSSLKPSSLVASTANSIGNC